MLRFAWLLLPLAACYEGAGDRYATGECPAGETCSPLTPDGLQFVGASFSDTLFQSGPHPTAIGGRQQIELLELHGHAYGADVDGGSIRVDSTNSNVVTISGVTAGSDYLRIVDADGLLMDRKELAALPLDRIVLGPTLWESIPADRAVAFPTGLRRIVVALYSGTERIVDDNMSLELAGATRWSWDSVKGNLVAGSQSLTVTAGDKPAATLDIVAVDHADTVQVQANQPDTATPNYEVQVCFEALAAGRYVAELEWSYAVNGEPVGGSNVLVPNCLSVQTTQNDGELAITATADGKSATHTLAIVTAATGAPRLPPPAARSLAIPTAGDRAAM